MVPPVFGYWGPQPQEHPGPAFHRGVGEGYAVGYDRGWKEGQAAAALGQPSAARQPPVGSSEADEGAGVGGRSSKRKGKSGKYKAWCAEHEKSDPPDLKKYPRFEFWNDMAWSPYLETTQVKIRDACVKNGEDHGTIETSGEFAYDIGKGDPGYVYNLNIQSDKNHSSIKAAIQSVCKHAFWNPECEDQVCGWQANKKGAVRPIRAVWPKDMDEKCDDDASGDGRENN